MESLAARADLRAALDEVHPEGDPAIAIARVAWSVAAEPGDGVAGALIASMGAVEALEFVQSGGGALAEPGRAGRELRDGLRRWAVRWDPDAISRAVTHARDVGARLVLPGDAEWPDELSDLGPHAPSVLWVRGEMALLRAQPRVAIVGARAASGYGEHLAGEFAGDLAMNGAVIVSGGAYGIDGAVHRAALGVEGATVAFLAGGVDRPYPQGHQDLLQRIVATGAVVSEVPCGTAPTRWRFLARNRLIAAVSHATVVVEAGWRSGSLNTAGHAAALGRPLGAVPGPVTSAASAGCHRLLREYDARCVTTAGEIRELWAGAESVARGESASPQDPDRTRLLDALSPRIAVVTRELARRSGLSPERVGALLGLLELEGRVQRSEEGWRRADR